MGAFVHLEWTYDGAFEQLFGLGRGEFSKNFPKIQMPGGLSGGGMLKLRFDWYVTTTVKHLKVPLCILKFVLLPNWHKFPNWQKLQKCVMEGIWWQNSRV